MKILILTIGSAGDVHPFIALGKELQGRGHQITFYTSDYFEADIRKAGLEFAAMFSSEEFAGIMDHPDLWDPLRGFELLYRKVFVPLAPVNYRFITERYVPGETGVVMSTLAFGARIAQEKHRVPTVTVHLQPSVFRSIYDTPVYPGLRMGPGMPRGLKRLLFWLMDKYIDRIITPGLNGFRTTLGLPPTQRIFAGWFNSPDGVLGLFPDWFGPPQPDWPARTDLSGFPLYDAAAEHPVPPEVESFLAAGELPVIFTAGSAMKQGRWFFQAAVEACERLKCRGLLINKFREQVPERLPEGVLYADYVPFSRVFHRARVVVHHGGIGTTAQVLAAGVPHLLVPIAFDQNDQAMRVERLGAGLQLARRDFTGGNVAAKLRHIVESSAMAERARELAAGMNGPAAVSGACDFIEQSFRRSLLS
jgi:rhamnosyltransferase subunit B